MSVEKAQHWLQNHSQLIPALALNQHEIVRLLDLHQHAHKVVQIAITDPGLCLALLIKINSKRGNSASKDIVESPQAAIALLGEQVSHTLFKDFTVAETVLQEPDQLFLFQQLINRSLHNEKQAESWASRLGFQNMELIKVAALLAYIGELLCCVQDFKNYRKYIQSGSSESQCEAIFGFKFFELTEILCETSNLPPLIARALPHKSDNGQTVGLLNFSARLCHQSEHGWYNDEMQHLFEQFAEWLQQPVDSVISRTHEFSILAARNTPVPDAWQPAARLILTQDQLWALPQLQQEQEHLAEKKSQEQSLENTTKTPAEDVFAIIKKLVQQPTTKQSEVLSVCLKSLFQDLCMSRVSLFLLTPNRKNLHNRMSIGVEKNSPLRELHIDLEKSSLLKILLNKPQAIWINQNSLKKYQTLIPQSFMASIMTDNFLAMSLFIADKPLGIVYADRSNTTETIDPEIFTQFKKLISFTSKALTLISKR